MREQHRALRAKLWGHYAYYGLTGNFKRLDRFRDEVRRTWRTWLDRRNRERAMSWEKFQRLEKNYPLPRAKVVHSVYARAANP